MQVRAQAVKQVLLGYLRVPESPDAPLDVVLNPSGAERRAERRVWNNGDGRIKLVRRRVDPAPALDSTSWSDHEHETSRSPGFCIWRRMFHRNPLISTLRHLDYTVHRCGAVHADSPAGIFVAQMVVLALQITQAKKEGQVKSARLRAAAARTAIAETLGRSGVQVAVAQSHHDTGVAIKPVARWSGFAVHRSALAEVQRRALALLMTLLSHVHGASGVRRLDLVVCTCTAVTQVSASLRPVKHVSRRIANAEWDDDDHGGAAGQSAGHARRGAGRRGKSHSESPGAASCPASDACHRPQSKRASSCAAYFKPPPVDLVIIKVRAQLLAQPHACPSCQNPARHRLQVVDAGAAEKKSFFSL